MTNLEKAKRDYPKGTEFLCGFTKHSATSDGTFKEYKGGNIGMSPFGEYVFYKGKWAEIISKPEPTGIITNKDLASISKKRNRHIREANRLGVLINTYVSEVNSIVGVEKTGKAKSKFEDFKFDNEVAIIGNER